MVLIALVLSGASLKMRVCQLVLHYYTHSDTLLLSQGCRKMQLCDGGGGGVTTYDCMVMWCGRAIVPPLQFDHLVMLSRIHWVSFDMVWVDKKFLAPLELWGVGAAAPSAPFPPSHYLSTCTPMNEPYEYFTS